MEEFYSKKTMSSFLLVVLLVLVFFLIKPILVSIIFGLILAFIFNPLYKRLYKKIKMPNLSAFLICMLFILLIILPLWFLTPVIINQSVQLYVSYQQVDLTTSLKTLFPSLLSSEELLLIVESSVDSLVVSMINSFGNYISIDNFLTILFQSFVVFFTFFFALRDSEVLINYVKKLLPFSKELEKKLFDSSKLITSSVIYGQVIVGLAQGIVAGIGFFLFGVPNALFLTLLASLAGVFPIIGTAIVWFPVVIYLVIAGNVFPALGVAIFGTLSSTLDNFLRPLIVSKRTQLPSSLILIGMIGGFFLLGFLGFILGPLIIAYLLIALNIYIKNKSS